MKVCLYVHSLGTGGAERQIVNLARELASRDVQVVLLHTQKNLQDTHYLLALKQQRVEVISALSPKYLREGIRLSKLHEDFFRNIPAASSQRIAILYIAGVFSLLKPHIVHSYLDLTNCAAGCAAVLADIPVHLASFHSMSPATGHFSWEEMTYALYRYLILHAHPHFEACSRASAYDYARWLDIAPEKVTYSPNGLDPTVYLESAPDAGASVRQELGIPLSAPVLLSLSRFIPAKAPEAQLDIFRRVLAVRPDCHFILAGSGMSEDAEMGELLRSSGPDRHVHLLGVRSDVAALLASADIFLLPSRIESFPLSIMEAMAMELPVVASRVGGIPDLVRDGEDGFLHEASDLEGMAQSVVRLVDDATLRDRQGRSGKQRVLEEFSLKKMGDRAMALYEELLQNSALGVS